MTRQHAGFAGVVQHEWPRPRAWARPSGSTRASRRCPASARRSRSGCARSGSLGRDLLLHRPRRYERAADEIAISQLWGDEEVVIAGVVQDVRTRRLGGRRSIVTARDRGRERLDQRVVVQPALARSRSCRPGRTCGCAGKLGRYGFDVKSYDVGEPRATADFAPVYPASEQVPSTQLRELVRARSPSTCATSTIRCRPSSSCRCGATRSRAVHFPRRRGGGRGGAQAARARRAGRAAARRRALARRRCRRGAARAARRAGRRATARCCRSS